VLRRLFQGREILKNSLCSPQCFASVSCVINRLTQADCGACGFRSPISSFSIAVHRGDLGREFLLVESATLLSLFLLLLLGAAKISWTLFASLLAGSWICWTVVGTNVLLTSVGVCDCSFYKQIVMSCSMIVSFLSSWVESQVRAGTRRRHSQTEWGWTLETWRTMATCLLQTPR
jgi:hypothetical protein